MVRLAMLSRQAPNDARSGFVINCRICAWSERRTAAPKQQKPRWLETFHLLVGTRPDQWRACMSGKLEADGPPPFALGNEAPGQLGQSTPRYWNRYT